MDWWHDIVNYYASIGKNHQVNPVIFVAIHIVATPIFAASVWWIIFQKRNKKSLVIPVLVAVLIFNAANLYLIFFGKNIPFGLYAFVATTTLISGFLTIQKIRKKLTAQ